MKNENLPALRETALTTGLKIIATGNVKRLMSDPETAPLTVDAIRRAKGFAEGVDFVNPRTVMFPLPCPLTVHADPRRGVVIIMSKFPGWPAVTEDLVEAILPFCSSMSFPVE